MAVLVLRKGEWRKAKAKGKNMESKQLVINNISVVYSDVIQVLKGVSLSVEQGQIVSLL